MYFVEWGEKVKSSSLVHVSWQALSKSIIYILLDSFCKVCYNCLFNCKQKYELHQPIHNTDTTFWAYLFEISNNFFLKFISQQINIYSSTNTIISYDCLLHIPMSCNFKYLLKYLWLIIIYTKSIINNLFSSST